MSRQILVPETTQMGGLFSITDEYPQHTRGCKYEKVDKNGNIAVLEYLYNAIAAAAVQGVFYLKDQGASAASPSVDGFTVTNAEVSEIAVAQAAIPSLYWGWYLTKGRSSVTGIKMYWDGVDQNGTDDCTDGESFTITNGIAACDDAAPTFPTDTPRTVAGTVSETLATAATTVHVELAGGYILCAT